MVLVDLVEQLGQQVENGTISRDDAAQRIVEYSEGGLTKHGALDMLARWRSARGTYSDVEGQE